MGGAFWGAFIVRLNSSRPRVRLSTSRSRGSYALAVIGSCLGVYAVFAVAFHWLVEPTLAKNQPVAAYEPSPVRIVQPAAPSVVPAVRSEPASRVASKPATSATSAAPARESKETARVTSKPPATATAAVPQPTESARSEPPSRAAPQPPAAAMAAAPAAVTESARSEPPLSSAVSEQPAPATVAAATPESTETAATEPKKPPKKKVARTTSRQRDARDWNPFNFFAWQPSYGARRSF
jgi:hypothetical protein